MNKNLLSSLIILIGVVFFGILGYTYLQNESNDRISQILHEKAREGEKKTLLKESVIRLTFSAPIQDIIYLKYKTNLDENSDEKTLKQDLIYFLESRNNIDQIRFLDTLGFETFRIQREKNRTKLVAKEDLQDKSKRSYFQQSKSLKKEEIYLSPLDLNMERGKIEKPYKPTVRMVSNFYKNNSKIGELVVNYNMSEFLNTFQDSEDNKENYFLVNDNFGVLSSPKNKFCFDFILKDSSHNLFRDFPILSSLKENGMNNLISENNILLFNQANHFNWYNEHVTKGEIISDQSNNWGIVYHFPKNEIDKLIAPIKSEFKNNLIRLLITCIFILIVIFYFKKKRQDHLSELKSVNNGLELTVSLRTTQLKEKVNHIMDSLNYAQKVQAATFPPKKIIKSFFDESFVLFLPKDIVAGDFYWFSNCETEGEIIFAVADCTGHGVPGAMVSLICINVLNKVIKVEKINSPSEILNRVSEMVEEQFINKSENNINDGMDISLCKLNLKTRELKWAGANSPLWVVKSEDKVPKLMEIKGARYGIGGTHFGKKKSFKEHSFILDKNDIIYLFSDGFQDQFSGQTDKKLRRSGFRKVILEASQINNMDDQYRFLQNYFTKWKQGSTQIDDVSVVGLKL